MKVLTLRFLQHLIAAALALGVFLALSARLGAQPAHALPEYADRTGEQCATCHVNPGGGGPRTLRGLLWAARGQPDQVPSLPGLLIAPGVADGQELYAIACAGCHGNQGQGGLGMPIAGTQISRPAIQTYLLEGIPGLGMPSFQGQFTDAQIETLLDFMAGLANGQITPPLDQYPLAPPVLGCDPLSPTGLNCGDD